MAIASPPAVPQPTSPRSGCKGLSRSTSSGPARRHQIQENYELHKSGKGLESDAVDGGVIEDLEEGLKETLPKDKDSIDYYDDKFMKENEKFLNENQYHNR